MLVGLGFYVNPPILAPIVPGRGVVGHYIDRWINSLHLSNHLIHFQACCISDFDTLFWGRNFHLSRYDKTVVTFGQLPRIWIWPCCIRDLLITCGKDRHRNIIVWYWSSKWCARGISIHDHSEYKAAPTTMRLAARTVNSQ